MQISTGLSNYAIPPCPNCKQSLPSLEFWRWLPGVPGEGLQSTQSRRVWWQSRSAEGRMGVSCEPECYGETT